MRPSFVRYLRIEIAVATVLVAICAGLILAGNHGPVVVGTGVVAAIVVAGDRFVGRGRL